MDMQPVTYGVGQVLFVQGEPSKTFYLIKTGEIRVFQEDDRGTFLLFICGPGDFVGETNVLTECSRHASAIVAEEASVYVFDKTDVGTVVEQCPEWIRHVLLTLSERVGSTLDMMVEHRIPYLDEEVDIVIPPKYRKAFERYRQDGGLG